MTDTAVYRSAIASLVAQVLLGVVTAFSYALHLPPDVSVDLQPILAFELGSQALEFAYYALVVFRFKRIVTWTRYLDWVWSTPAMLLSTALFFYHRRGRDVWEVFDAPLLYACLACNWAMLGIGFAMESARVPRFAGLALGGAAFVASFTSLGTLCDGTDPWSAGVFFVMYVVWAGYGVAAALEETRKNVAYNALDVVAKNFYGVFLFAYALSRVAG